MNKKPIYICLTILIPVSLLLGLAGSNRVMAQIIRNPQGADDEPPAAYDQALNTVEETEVSITLNASDPDGDELTWAIVDYPDHGDLIGSPPNVNYSPELDFDETDSFTFKVNDGTSDSSIATVTITIIPVNDPPVAVVDTYETAVNVNIVIVNAVEGVLANDYDPDNNLLTAILIDNPDIGVLTFREDGTFTYKVAVGYIGTQTFTYVVSDGLLLSQVACVTINITDINTPPVAVLDTYTTYTKSTLVVPPPGVLANDIDAEEDNLTAQLTGGAVFGYLYFYPNGSFSYTPFPNYIGDDHFTYTASDGLDVSNPVMVTITVTYQPLFLPMIVK